MSAEAAYLLLIVGVMMNAYSTYPLIRAELQYTEGCEHQFFVWAAFLVFFGGIVFTVVGSWPARDWLNTAGLSLEVVATLLATPELLASLGALDSSFSSRTTKRLLVAGTGLFILGLGCEFASTFVGADASLLGTPVNRMGLGFTFLAFFPFLVLSLYSEDTLEHNRRRIQLGIWLFRLLIFVPAMVVLWMSGMSGASDSSKIWLFPFFMLCFAVVQEIVYQMRPDPPVSGRLFVFSMGINLIYIGYHFQLAAVFFNNSPS